VFSNFGHKYLPPTKIGGEIFRNKSEVLMKLFIFYLPYSLCLNDCFLLVTSIVAKYIIDVCICEMINDFFYSPDLFICTYSMSKIFQIKLQGISVCFNYRVLTKITKFVLS